MFHVKHGLQNPEHAERKLKKNQIKAHNYTYEEKIWSTHERNSLSRPLVMPV